MWFTYLHHCSQVFYSQYINLASLSYVLEWIHIILWLWLLGWMHYKAGRVLTIFYNSTKKLCMHGLCEWLSLMVRYNVLCMISLQIVKAIEWPSSIIHYCRIDTKMIEWSFRSEWSEARTTQFSWFTKETWPTKKEILQQALNCKVLCTVRTSKP